MAEGILDELYESVVSVCDSLYAGRQLITKNAVKRALEQHGRWSEPELEALLPKHINDWRLQTLAKDQSLTLEEKILYLETQLCKYKADMRQAQDTINRLKSELILVSQTAQQQRQDMIQTLRGLLSA